MGTVGKHRVLLAQKNRAPVLQRVGSFLQTWPRKMAWDQFLVKLKSLALAQSPKSKSKGEALG